MSNIPLTEGNLQSLQSQQYGSGGHQDSGLLTSGIALMDGAAAKDRDSAPYLTPEAADGIVSELLQQFYHLQEWQVPWPRPQTTPLLYVPDTITTAFDCPKAPTIADLDAMAIGLVESIPFAHDLMYPEHERLRTQLSKNLSFSQQQITEQGLHAPYQTAKERNADLPDEDFALIDVDFCASGHGQRHLPSITFLQRPSYTEIGLAPAERREEERRQAVAQSMPNLLSGLTQQGSVAGMTQQLQSTQLAAEPTQTQGTTAAVSQWNVNASRTFKHAKQLDVCYSQWVSDAATLKLGLLPVHGHNSALTPNAIAKLTTRLLNLVGYITANGVVLGARRNDTNQTFYNQQQGKLVGGIVWKYLCALAAEAWGQWAQRTAPNAHPPRLLNLPPSTITARILDDARFDELMLGSQSTREALQAALDEVIGDYMNALKQSVQGNKKAPCPLVQTASDYVAFNGLDSQVLPSAVSLVPADASALAQRPRTDYENEVDAPLFFASNVPLHPTLTKIAEAGEASRRMATRGAGSALPRDEELTSTFRTQDLTEPNGAVPLVVMPVFPEGFEKIAKEIAEGHYSQPSEALAAMAGGFGNAHRNLQHVVLNGERNGYIPGSYVPSDIRTPNVLFNDRLHFRPLAVADEAAAVSSDALSGTKRNRRGDNIVTSSTEVVETTAYTTGTTQSKFEKYLADQSSTISYVMKVVQPNPDDDNAAVGFANGPIVTYGRIPTLTRYKRAQARITAEDVMKTVTVSWAGNEAEAKNEQLSLVAGDDEAQ